MRLKINDLPARSKTLTEDEISMIFGSGRRDSGARCSGSCYWSCKSKKGKPCPDQSLLPKGTVRYCCA